MAKRKKESRADLSQGTGSFSNNPFAALGGSGDSAPTPEPPAAPVAPANQSSGIDFGSKVVLRFERKGHGGKTVTLVQGLGLRGAEAEGKGLAKQLAKSLGCSVRLDGDELVVSGDQRERLRVALEAMGARRIVVS